MPKRNFDLQTFETEDYDESPNPGETLIFKDNGKEYVPPEEPKEKEKEKKEESRSLTEVYGSDPEVYLEVIDYWGLKWPTIEFIANHGVQTNLKAWRIKQDNDPTAYARGTRGKAMQFSKLALFKFFRKFEAQIWEGAEYIGKDLVGSDCTALQFIGTLNGAKDIHSLNDIGVLAAKWAIEEVCQRVNDDYENYSETEDEGEFRDIWQPPVERQELHTDVGGYDESIMRRLRSG